MLQATPMAKAARIALVMIAGCWPSHFEVVVRQAEAARAPCYQQVEVRALNAYAYRVDACEVTTFYRCYSKRKSMGGMQCCYRAENEAAATAMVSFDGAVGGRRTELPGETCQAFVR